MSKNYRYRKNIRDYKDADYKDKLNAEELEWYKQFENEYYSNALGKEGSIHHTELSEDDFIKAKKQTYDATNSQNRDVYGIASCSTNYLKFIDDDGNYIEPVASTSTISKIVDPEYAFNIFLEQTMDELQSSVSRDMKIVLTEFAIELVSLGVSLRKDRVSSALKKKKAQGDK